MRFLGKLLKVPNFLKGDGFLRVVQCEYNDRVVVPKECLVYESPYYLPL